MALEIQNTLSGQKELFEPIRWDTDGTPRIGMYVCGPTVYSDAHVGHAKSYVTFDIVARYLRFLGYRLTYVQNITDVGHLTDDADSGEDKLEVQGRREHRHPMEIAEYYTRRYYEDMAELNVLPPDIAPRATGHIIEQIELIKTLIAHGVAYEADGNVYFDVTKDPEYGKLSGRRVEDQEASGRVQTRSDKRNPQDFALWKRAEAGHIMRWPSPWGVGFPGWHVECSAMSMKYLGETIDIHGGGLENQFPHHECELAQSESATGSLFVRFWMHNNMVTVGGKKMGKSLGNSAYLRDLFQSYPPLALRYALLLSHYRNTTEFTEEALGSARNAYKRLTDTFQRLARTLENPSLRTLTAVEKESPLFRAFIAAMDNDFNTPQAIAVIQELAAETNSLLDHPSGAVDSNRLESLFQYWRLFCDTILGFLPTATSEASDANKTSDLMEFILQLRSQARAAKDFATSDAIRDRLDQLGIAIEDAKQGTGWRLK